MVNAMLLRCNILYDRLRALGVTITAINPRTGIVTLGLDTTPDQYAAAGAILREHDANGLRHDWRHKSSAWEVWAAADYASLRRAAYPPGGDALDAMAKMSSPDPAIAALGEAQMQAYSAACMAVKERYPKPE